MLMRLMEGLFGSQGAFTRTADTNPSGSAVPVPPPPFPPPQLLALPLSLPAPPLPVTPSMPGPASALVDRMVPPHAMHVNMAAMQHPRARRMRVS